MKIYIGLIFISFMFSVSYAHDTFQQHEIIHLYPSLEKKKNDKIEHNCDMGIIERVDCNQNNDDTK